MQNRIPIGVHDAKQQIYMNRQWMIMFLVPDVGTVVVQMIGAIAIANANAIVNVIVNAIVETTHALSLRYAINHPEYAINHPAYAMPPRCRRCLHF